MLELMLKVLMSVLTSIALLVTLTLSMVKTMRTEEEAALSVVRVDQQTRRMTMGTKQRKREPLPSLVMAATSSTSTTTTNTTLYIDASPSLWFETPHRFRTGKHLLELSDGSFVSWAADKKVKRWLIHSINSSSSDSSSSINNDSGYNEDYSKDSIDDNTGGSVILLVGTYKGHQLCVTGVVEKDNDALITASEDGTLKVWSITSCECLQTVSTQNAVRSMIKSRDNDRVYCGLDTGVVEVRRLSDLALVSSFDHDHEAVVYCICELEDGSIVSGCETIMKRWLPCTGEVLQTFSKHECNVWRIIQLNKKVIVSTSVDSTLKMWNVHTGECIRTIRKQSSMNDVRVQGLVKLSKEGGNYFASGGLDRELRVWNERGECIETIRTGFRVGAIAVLRSAFIVTINALRLEIRWLK